MAENARSPEQAGTRDAAFYLSEIDLASRHERPWRERAWRLEIRYRGESDANRATGSGDYTAEINTFYSNVELLKPATFSGTPAPDVRRRFRPRADQDPADDVAKRVAEAIEGCLAFWIEDAKVDRRLEAVRDDALIVGRGVPWVSYLAETHDEDVDREIVTDPATGEDVEVFAHGDELAENVEIREDGEIARPVVVVKDREEIRLDHVNWRDYRETAGARSWEDVWWVARRHRMSRRQARAEFGPRLAGRLEYAEESPDEQPDQRDRAVEEMSRLRKAEVWELWDRDAGKRVWLSRGVDDILRDDGDPLGLSGFFPMPRPFQTIESTHTRVPVPEFVLYQDAANEMDELATRQRTLVRALKAIGLVDAATHGLPDLRDHPDATLVPITRPPADKTLSQSIEWWPIENVATVLGLLDQRIQVLDERIMRVTGLSDLMRGDTRASESATAQRIKGMFGQFRLTDRSAGMAIMIRDLMEIVGEIIAEMFDPTTIERWSGVPVDAAMAEMMQTERVRQVRINIETAETVRADAEERKARGIEYLQALAQFTAGILPVIQAVPPLGPPLLRAVQSVNRSFKFGRQVEEEFDAAIDQLAEMAAAPPQQEQPSPDARLKAETDMAEAEMRQETEAAKLAAQPAPVIQLPGQSSGSV